MIVIHSLKIESKCPEDGSLDIYRCKVKASRLIKVEDILAAVKELTQQPAHQEALTESLSKKLACQVETVGNHSSVRTRVICGGRHW